MCCPCHFFSEKHKNSESRKYRFQVVQLFGQQTLNEWSVLILLRTHFLSSSGNSEETNSKDTVKVWLSLYFPYRLMRGASNQFCQCHCSTSCSHTMICIIVYLFSLCFWKITLATSWRVNQSRWMAKRFACHCSKEPSPKIHFITIQNCSLTRAV